MQAGFGHHCHHRRLDSLQRASNGDHLLLAAHLDLHLLLADHLDPLLLLLIIRLLLLPAYASNMILRIFPFLLIYLLKTLERTSWLSFRSLSGDHLLNYILLATSETKVYKCIQVMEGVKLGWFEFQGAGVREQKGVSGLD